MIAQLMQASIGGAIAVTLVWLTCRAVPTLSAATRAWLWWCVSAKFVVALVWVSPIAIAILPASAQRVVVAPSTNPVASLTASPSLVSPEQTSSSALSDVGRMSWLEPIVLAIWAIGVTIAALVALRRWRRAHRIIRESQPATEDLRGVLVEIAASLHLQPAPELRVSRDVETPLVVGVLRPVVIVPGATFDGLGSAQQRMALAHECVHVRRRDLRLGCLPAIAEALFFFHPLARLASREYALWREAACDAAVIEALDAAPRDYGQLLLGLGVTKPRVGLAAAGASWSASNLKRRLHMLAEPVVRSNRSRLLSAAVVVTAALAVLPLRLTERVEAAIVPLEIAPLNSVEVEDEQSAQAKVSRPDPESAISVEKLRAAAQKNGGDLNFVLLHDDDTSTMSGRFDDIKRVKQLAGGKTPLLWFRHNGGEYSTRDPQALREALAIWKPIREIGEEQGRVGEAQGRVGEKQGEIGAKQGKIGEAQGRLGEEEAELALREAELNLRAIRAKSDVDRRAIDKELDSLDAKRDELSSRMKNLDREMRSLDKTMSGFEKEMTAVGAPMEELSRKMEAAQQSADSQMKTLIERLIANGTAQRIK